jgi:hypothetical protein
MIAAILMRALRNFDSASGIGLPPRACHPGDGHRIAGFVSHKRIFDVREM